MSDTTSTPPAPGGDADRGERGDHKAESGSSGRGSHANADVPRDARSPVESTARTEIRHYHVDRDGGRLDATLARLTGCGRRRAGLWIRMGLVRVNGRPAVAASRPRTGDVLEVTSEAAPADDTPRIAVAPAENIRSGSAGEEGIAGSGIPTQQLGTSGWREDSGLDSNAPESARVLLEHGDYFAILKPAGLHTHRGRHANTLADAAEKMLGDLSSAGSRTEGGLAHRLDRDTSGVVLGARTAEAFTELREMFGRGKTCKEYLALCSRLPPRRETIDVALTRRRSRVVPARRKDRALAAETLIEPLEGGAGWGLVRARMTTGAPHQIRAHLSLIGCPLIGDTKYGGPAAPAGFRTGHLLHAQRIQAEGLLDVTAPVPSDFLRAFAHFRGR